MEALSGAAQAAYRQLIDHPDLLPYYQAASPLEEISSPESRFPPGSPLRRPVLWATCARSRGCLPGRRTAILCPAGTAWAAAFDLLEVRGQRGAALLDRMFAESRLFRLIVDEVEKTFTYVDLDIAREYAELVPAPSARTAILALIEEEYHRTVEAVLRISGGRELVERYPRFRRRLARRLPTINQVSRQQIELLRRFRESGGDRGQEEQLSALLLSINTIAAGFGATG